MAWDPILLLPGKQSGHRGDAPSRPRWSDRASGRSTVYEGVWSYLQDCRRGSSDPQESERLALGPSCSLGGTSQTAEFGVLFRFLLRPSYPFLAAHSRPQRSRRKNSPQPPAPAPRGSPRPLELTAGTSALPLSCPSGQVAVPLPVPFGALSISCSVKVVP